MTPCRIGPRRIECCAFIFALLAFHAPATAPDDLIDLVGETMGTTWHIKVVAPDPEWDTLQAKSDVDGLLDAVNDQMSTWREESEISRFNRHTADDWFPVSPEFARVVQRSLEVAEDSGGAFDPTVSPLVGLWNFGADAAHADVPSDEAVADALRHVDYRMIDVRSDPPALRKRDPEVRLDLSAIAKGHGVDRVADLLSESGASAWMIEIGGEVRTRGRKPYGSPWRIGIERPVAGQRLLDSALELNDSAMATSGDYRNYFDHDGVRYSHTINPATGRPVTHQLASVSVLAEDCMTADAWATALMVLGPDDGLVWAEQRGIAAYFIVHADGGFTSVQTDGFPDRAVVPLLATEPAAANDASPWTTFLLALVVFGVAVIGLALGVIFSNRRLRGSCGGLAGMQDDQGRPICEACTNPAEECDEFRRRAAAPATESNESDSA